MNDVINSQGYTQAAWWNRIPGGGLGAHGTDRGAVQPHARLHDRQATNPAPSSVILPLVTAIAFFLIADIDSPRHGLIHIVPQNLLALAATLR